jgi:hypothetical protein
VNCFTLAVIVILMETIKDVYISVGQVFARLRGSVDCSLIGLKSASDDHHRQEPDHDFRPED